MYQTRARVRIANVSGDGKARLLERRRIFEGRLVTLEVDRVVEPSGMEVEREVLRHPGAAVLLPVTHDGRVVLVRQYRYAAGEFLLEVPAGTIKDCLESVTPWQAEVFVLRHIENLPIQEIAQRTSRSNDAIRSSLYRVKRLLVEAGNPEGASARS